MRHRKSARWRVSVLVAGICLATAVQASLGDRLPDFKDCVKVDLYYYPKEEESF
jgi:hypothetical protein